MTMYMSISLLETIERCDICDNRNARWDTWMHVPHDVGMNLCTDCLVNEIRTA